MDFNLKVSSKEDFIADMAAIGVDARPILFENYLQTDKAIIDWIGEHTIPATQDENGVELTPEVSGLFVNVRTLQYQLPLSLPPDVAGFAAQAAGVPIYEWEKVISVYCTITQELNLSNLPHCTVVNVPIRVFA